MHKQFNTKTNDRIQYMRHQNEQHTRKKLKRATDQDMALLQICHELQMRAGNIASNLSLDMNFLFTEVLYKINITLEVVLLY